MDRLVICQACEGFGYFEHERFLRFAGQQAGEFESWQEDCQECDGTGKVPCEDDDDE